MRNKWLILVVIVAAGAAVAISLSRNRNRANEESSSTLKSVSLVTAAAQDPVSLDPAKLTDTESAQFVTATFAPLSLVNSAGQLECVLAESIDVAPDALQAKITLRQNAFFSDGSPVTATDVRFTFERLFRMAHPQRFVIERIEGIKALGEKPSDHASGFQIIDERTLVVKFDQPDPEFPKLISNAFCGIVKAGSDDQPKKPLDGQLIGAGPFVLERAEPGFRYQFVANKGFPLDHRLGSLEIKILDNEQEVVRQASSGSINLLRLRGNQLREVAEGSGSALKVRSNFTGKQLKRFPSQDLVYLRVNWKSAGMNGVSAPHRDWLTSLGESINKQKLVESLYLSTAAVADAPVASGSTVAGSATKVPLQAAKLELITAAVGELRQVSDSIVSDLRNSANVEVDLRSLAIGDFVKRLFGGDYQIALLWLESNISVPDLSWATFFSADGGISALAQPMPEVAKHLNDARSITNEAERRKAFASLLDEINKTQDVIVPLVRRESVFLVSDDVTNPGADMNGILHFSLVEGRR